MKLISMVDRVLSFEGSLFTLNKRLEFITEYAKFLKQPLYLYMFVPCIYTDGAWHVCADEEAYLKNCTTGMQKLEYQQAKERVLFEGDYEVHTNKHNTQITFNHSRALTQIIMNGKTVEDLLRYQPTLTTNTQKQLGL